MAADPLVLRPSVGCKASDAQSGQEYAGSGRSDLEHSGVQIQGHRHTASARLSAATAAACLYPEGQWEAETVGNPHDEGSVSYTHLRAHETGRNLVCRLLLEKKKKTLR